MKNFKTEFQMIEYMIEQLNFEPNLSLIISKEYLNCILESIDFDCKSFTKEVDSEKYTYLIEKFEDDEENIHIEVVPVEFDDDGLIYTEVDNDFVIVQENVLDEDDIDMISFDEELTIVDYEEECNCNECCQGCCSDELTDEQDLIEEYALLIENTGGCPDCIRRILNELIEDVKETNDDEIIENTYVIGKIELPYLSNTEGLIRELKDLSKFTTQYK